MIRTKDFIKSTKWRVLQLLDFLYFRPYVGNHSSCKEFYDQLYENSTLSPHKEYRTLDKASSSVNR